MSMKNFNVGRTYGKPQDYKGKKHPISTLPGCKLARRLVRTGLKRAYSRIESNIMKARRNRIERERYASNSHEAKRYAAERGLGFGPVRGVQANIDALKAFASR